MRNTLQEVFSLGLIVLAVIAAFYAKWDIVGTVIAGGFALLNSRRDL
jgi:hypothetical protein